ncbi:MAG: outer membrane beta-barrel family protein [Saprospiraceae bacterium]
MTINMLLKVCRITFVFAFALCNLLYSQQASIHGKLQDKDNQPLIYANILLFNEVDNQMIKAIVSDESGKFIFNNLHEGKYNIVSKYVGLEDYKTKTIELNQDQSYDLGLVKMITSPIQLEQAVVSAKRKMIEVKPDRLIFNVEGTINSTGSDGISLLRKAPSVMIDNNNNIIVLGRSGVIVYVDGKRLPLNGEDLTNYLQNLTADQIDRIDIITNPGVKYEAEGNAGIIDIKLKRNSNYGKNGSLNLTTSQGRYNNINGGLNLNYRNSKMNAFAQAGIGHNKGYHDIDFISYQNGLYIEEINLFKYENNNRNLRFGSDFFINKKNTIGFLATARGSEGIPSGYNSIKVANENNMNNFDSILIATTETNNLRRQNTYNINYRFNDLKDKSLTVDLDYGSYKSRNNRYQPNQYYKSDGTTPLSGTSYYFETPSDILIYSLKMDYEQSLWKGVVGVGTKIGDISSDNTYLVIDVINGSKVQNNRRSNDFKYLERNFAAYINYQRSLSKRIQINGGIRTEKTIAKGDLFAYLPELQQPPVDLNYLSWFPNIGINFEINSKNSIGLSYGKRINRPDYNVLNPFNNQLSQLSFERGNPFLKPEIVNNFELSYNNRNKYNLKIGYSITDDQITRLIGPDSSDLRASYINWENLATQKVWSSNLSFPIEIFSWWNSYWNISASHIQNLADYGEGAKIDIKVFNFNFYQQQTFNLPKKLNLELSGYYSGPGVWGGVFITDASWSLDIGIQKKFFNEKLNVKLSGSDLFFQSFWSGYSDFDGLYAKGKGLNDSRKAAISMVYKFGNQKVKSRNHKTGIEDEEGRVK